MITQHVLKEQLHYDLSTGVFRWNVSHSKKIKIGQIAGTTTVKGYRAIHVDGKIYLAHRIAWLYVFGEWPKGIDHKNGIKSDNRIDNLRLANQSQNLANIGAKKNNELGIRGVCRYGKKYRVALNKNGKQVWIGYFESLETASLAAEKASKELHGDFSFHNRLQH
jgi:hypothetical protein